MFGVYVLKWAVIYIIYISHYIRKPLAILIDIAETGAAACCLLMRND